MLVLTSRAAALSDAARTPTEAAFAAVFDPFVGARHTEPALRPPRPARAADEDDAMAVDASGSLPRAERKLKRWEKEKLRREKAAVRAVPAERGLSRLLTSALCRSAPPYRSARSVPPVPYLLCAYSLGVALCAQHPRSNLSAAFVRATAERCLRDRFWGPLGALIRTHELSARALPALVPTLMEQGQLVRCPPLCAQLSAEG
jgi:hypothetical protein